MFLSAKPIKAGDALELGLVDRVCRADELIETACDLLKSGERPAVTSRRTDKISDPEANSKAFDRAQGLVRKSRPEIIAGAKIVEAVRTGIEDSFEAGLKAEQACFAEIADV